MCDNHPHQLVNNMSKSLLGSESKKTWLPGISIAVNYWLASRSETKNFIEVGQQNFNTYLNLLSVLA